MSKTKDQIALAWWNRVQASGYIDHDPLENKYPHTQDNPAFSNEAIGIDDAPKRITVGGVMYERRDLRDRYKVPFLVTIFTIATLIALAIIA